MNLLKLISLVLISSTCLAAENLIYCRIGNYDLKYEKSKFIVSKDSKFAARATTGDGGFVRLSMYKWDEKGKRSVGKSLFSYPTATGFVWMPNSEHKFFFSLSSQNDPKEAGIYYWNVTSKRVVGGDDNEYSLAAVSKDGSKIVYDYWPNFLKNNSGKISPYTKSMNVREIVIKDK